MARSYNFFISDLHLDKDQPQLNDLFNQYCQQLLTWTQQKMKSLHIDDLANSKASFRVRLFILGDFLAKALGDEVEPWFKQQQDLLLELTALGIETYFTCGNRDFLLDVNFCDKVGMLCVEENEILEFMQDDLELNWRMANSFLTKKDLPNFKNAHIPEPLSINNQNKLISTVDERADIAQVFATQQLQAETQITTLNQANDNHLKDQPLDHAVNLDTQEQAALSQIIQDQTPAKTTIEPAETVQADHNKTAQSTNSLDSKVQTPIKLDLSQTDPVALSILLCHGDNLCLSDRGYLKFRHYIRSKFIRFVARSTPYWFKNKIGNYLRKKSYQSQINTNNTNNPNQNSNTNNAINTSRVKVTYIDVPYSFNLLSANQVHMGIFGHVHKQILLVRSNHLGFLEQQFTLAVEQFKQSLHLDQPKPKTSSKKTFRQRFINLDQDGFESKIEQKFNEFSKGFYDPDNNSDQAKPLKHHKLTDYTYADFIYDQSYLDQINQSVYLSPRLQKVVALPTINHFEEVCGEQGLVNTNIGYKVLEQSKAIHLNFKPKETKQGVFYQVSNNDILKSRILTQTGTTNFISSDLLRKQQILFSMSDWQTQDKTSCPISCLVLIHQLPEVKDTQAQFCLNIFNDFDGFNKLE